MSKAAMARAVAETPPLFDSTDSAPPTPTTDYNVGRLSPQLGTPLYVMEQPATNNGGGDTAFRLWEIRPSERAEQQMHTGSRLLLRREGLRATALALTGFEIDERGIRPGTLIVLTARGRLQRIALDDASKRGGGHLETLPGEYTSLEQAAEGSVMAVTREGAIVDVRATGAPQVLKSAEDLRLAEGERIITVARTLTAPRFAASPGSYRSLDIYGVTSAGRIISFSSAKYGMAQETQLEGRPPQSPSDVKLLIDGETIWMARHGEIQRLNTQGRVMNRINLTDHRMTQPDIQNGGGVELLGVKDGALYVRVGARAYSFEVAPNGTGLSYHLVDAEFFGHSLSRFGVQAGLHSLITVMQPREADRSGRRWWDVTARANPSLIPLWQTYSYISTPEERKLLIEALKKHPFLPGEDEFLERMRRHEPYR